MAQHNDLGNKGEAIAIDYLKRNGYKILETNYRFLKAEVDIIVQKEAIIAAVEVKTRSSNYFGNPQDFVSPKKIKLLISAMDHYIVHNNINSDVRFDIIAILKDSNSYDIKHIEDAFLFF